MFCFESLNFGLFRVAKVMICSHLSQQILQKKESHVTFFSIFDPKNLFGNPLTSTFFRDAEPEIFYLSNVGAIDY
jgi:hypothetical protein